MMLFAVHNMKVESMAITKDVLFEHFYTPGEFRDNRIDDILYD